MNSSSAKAASSAKDRVRKHRESLRAKGLKPVTFWIPDTKNSAFIAEYRRQLSALAAKIRANPGAEAEYWAWAEAIQCDEGWE